MKPVKTIAPLPDLEKLNHWFTAVLDHSPYSIMAFQAVRDNDGKITDLQYLFVNRKMLESVNRQDLVGKLFAEEFPATKQTGVFDQYVQVIETGKPWSDDTYYDENGADCWAHVEAVKLEDGCLVSYFDVTEQKKAERLSKDFSAGLQQEVKDQTERLKENKELLQTVIDAAPVSIAAFKSIRDKSGAIIDFEYTLANKMTETLAKIPELVGRRYSALFSNVVRDGIVARLAQVVEVGKKEVMELPYKDEFLDGWYHAVMQRFGDGLLIVTEDITERKKTEEEIKKLNHRLTTINRELESRNTELKTFNNIAATNYNETLRHLYTSMEYIINHEARNLSDTGRSNIRRAQSSIQKMKLLTEDMVSYTRLHEVDTEKQVVKLDNIIENVLADYKKKIDLSGIKIECNNLPAVVGYPSLILLLFHNLVDNVIKLRKEKSGAAITISCSEEEQQQLRYHVVSITDTGIGFSQQEAEKIFDIFHRLNEKGLYKGSRIGLAMCRKIIEMHGGFITAKSEPGKGSTFHCFFPA